MTQVTPPGWYPDPGQTNDAPPTERWWDGGAWTDRTRPTGTAAAAWGSPTPATPQYGAAAPPQGPYPAQPPQYGYPAQPAPGHPGYGAYPPAPPATPRRGLRIGIAVAAAVAVLTSIGVGVYALTDDGGSGDSGTAQGQDRPGEDNPFGDPGDRGGPGGPGGSEEPRGPGGESPSPDGSAPPKIRSGAVTDPLNGISIPIPKGWAGQQLQVGAQVSSESTYKCPGDTSKSCTKGGVYSAPAEALGTNGASAEAVAKADIAKNAEESYGGTTYGEITSHQVLASKAVTVAGQKGYLVRWKAVTSKGADGYVQSLAFPAPADAKRIVVLRFGLDADQKVSVIDEITEGVKRAEGGGSGQDV
ncbi:MULTISPECIES: DUF2510 domain-containing protein [unclassified Streptomyces]|uniref:DUF2510 domain-containing protein n=1 Tax=unclassified Streptomyces TaxID=2593676 RepID=UPI00382F602E